MNKIERKLAKLELTRAAQALGRKGGTVKYKRHGRKAMAQMGKKSVIVKRLKRLAEFGDPDQDIFVVDEEFKEGL